MQQSFELIQHQTQRLVMTQTLQQAILLLQMSSVELGVFVQEAVMENPLLEWLPAVKQTRAGSRTRSLGRIQDAALQAVSGEVDLAAHLHEQLRMTSVPEPLIPIVCYLIDSLDERGYLPLTCEEVARLTGAPCERVAQALAVLQQFEPCGVGAATLGECLMLQLERRNDHSMARDVSVYRLAKELIEDGLEWLAAGQYQKLQTRFRCSRSEIEAVRALLFQLDPHPGSAYSLRQTMYVVPDLALVEAERGYVVVMYDHAFPQLRFNEYYRSLAKTPLSAEEKAYFSQKTADALHLLRGIEARRRTVYRVAEAIAAYQADFFERGKQQMKPLTMKRLADELNLHESTVSRAVAGKYIETPQGVLEMKAFFSTSIATTNGESVSVARVHAILKEWIAEEDATAPLTDQELADRFLRDGIQVSRRTVSKYRDELKIPASSFRKRNNITNY